ncbi:zinc finger protein 839 [Elgaria multicarinata webbii]|uniref:zinc finger protein 839 n=1 Tax=Elgaria multicarinata webbii TaxID=159646 RepID=UPI002FCD1884
MAASERMEAVAQVQAAASSETLLYRQPEESLSTLVTEVGCRELEEPPGVVAGEGPRKLLDETPPPPLGNEAGRGDAEAAVTSQRNGAFPSPAQDNNTLAPPPPRPTLGEGFSLAASASPSGPLPPLSSILHNAAQQLQSVAQRVALQQGKSAAAPVAPTRLLPPKQLEAICVQVESEQKKGKERSALSPATVLSKNVTVAQTAVKNSRILGLNVINPQIIQLKPVAGTGSQQFFLCNSSEPTVQLLLQRPLHPLGQVSVGKLTTHGLLHGQKNKSVAAADSPNVALVSACSANSLINQEKKQEEQKVKKSLKVKTRSGRISRPPKYKAKDYKFIKTEDLADCHKSDSDDYSELNLEDDEGGEEKEVCSLFDPLNYDLRPKLFKCQRCEKSYIGKGGLARHYKLNPDHGQQELSPSSVNGMPLLEYTGKSDTSAEDRKSAEQQNTHLLHSGHGRPKRPRRRGRPKMCKRSRYSGTFSRPGQFPSKSLNMSAEHHNVFRRKANVKELIQQCRNEDFMELAVPRFTTLVTVFDFLLMKARKKCPAKVLLPDIYREFEELHAIIKKMCQDYFSSPELKEPLEIKDPKLAESLGITKSSFAVQKTQADSSPGCIKTTGGHVFTEISGQKRVPESSSEMLPFAKKTRVENLLENVNIDYSNDSGIKEISPTYEECSCAANTCCGNIIWGKEQHESLEIEVANDRLALDLHNCTQVSLESLQTSSTADCLTSQGETLSTIGEGSLQEELIQGNLSWNTAK